MQHHTTQQGEPAREELPVTGEDAIWLSEVRELAVEHAKRGYAIDEGFDWLCVEATLPVSSTCRTGFWEPTEKTITNTLLDHPLTRRHMKQRLASATSSNDRKEAGSLMSKAVLIFKATLPLAPKPDAAVTAWTNGVFYAANGFFRPWDEHPQTAQTVRLLLLEKLMVNEGARCLPPPLVGLIAGYVGEPPVLCGAPCALDTKQAFPVQWFHSACVGITRCPRLPDEQDDRIHDDSYFSRRVFSAVMGRGTARHPTHFAGTSAALIPFLGLQGYSEERDLWFVLGQLGRLMFRPQRRPDKWPALACFVGPSGSGKTYCLHACSRWFPQFRTVHVPLDWGSLVDKANRVLVCLAEDLDERLLQASIEVLWAADIPILMSLRRIPPDCPREALFVIPLHRFTDAADIKWTQSNLPSSSVAAASAADAAVIDAQFRVLCSEAYLWWADRFGDRPVSGAGSDWIPPKFRSDTSM